jgi:CHAT domain/Carbohydrate family 9 binding domain-like
MSRTYLDLDLAVSAEEGGYRVTARFGDDTVERTFPDPFDQADLKAFYDMFGGARVRGPEKTEHLERTRAFGDRLYRTVFADELDEMLVASKRKAEEAGQGLRIRLYLDKAPVLVNLPWEYLYRKPAKDFPALSSWTPLVRYLPVEEGPPLVRVTPPLKILVMISDPLGNLDTEAEWTSLQKALDKQLKSGLVEVERLPDATEAGLQVLLADHDVHVFHFIGHGEFDTTEEDGVLLLEDERQRTKRVTGDALGITLKDSRSLRLVVLNNCEGARAADVDPFTGVAQSLLQQGIPAVVAMQFEVTDQAAREFSRGFYGGIGSGFPVDGALAEGRKFMSRVAGGFEFGSPVLYLATPTGEIFDVAVSAPPPSPLPLPEDEVGGDGGEETGEEEHSEQDEKPSQGSVPIHEEGPGKPDDPSIPDEPERPRWPWFVAALIVAAVLAIFVLTRLGPDEDGGVTDESSVADATASPEDVADFDAVHLAAAPTIDGDGSDWPAGTPYPTPHVAEGEPDPRVSSEWRLGWDDEALYLFVVVSDPEVMVRHAAQPWLLYRGDGIDMIFGADPNRPGSELLRDDDIQVSIGPDTPEATGAVAGRQVPAAGSSNTGSECPGRVFGDGAAAPDVEAAATATGSGYQIEARVPWTVIGRAPDPGGVYGTILTVSDVDDDGSRRGSRSSNVDREAAKHCPSQWQTIELAP